MEKDCECVKCGWKWRSRTEKPLQCPQCTARYWWDPSRHSILSKDLKPTFKTPEPISHDEDEEIF